MSYPIDHYLIHKNCVDRLVSDYCKYGQLVIGVDFDDTIYDTYKKQRTHDIVISTLRKAQALNCKLCVWTANNNEKLVRERWSELDLTIDHYNESPIVIHSNQVKPYFSLLLDDRAGLNSAITALHDALQIIQKDNQ